MIGHNGHNCLLWGHFLSLWGAFSVFDFVVGVVSVLNLYFGECSSCSFSLLLSERELVQLVLLVALKCNANICILWCFDALRESCSDWYDWFCWSYYDIRLMHVICGYLTFYSETVTTVTTSFTGHTEISGFNPVIAVICSMRKLKRLL